jgi:hypothetical protein
VDEARGWSRKHNELEKLGDIRYISLGRGTGMKERSQGIITKTLGDLYFQQGLRTKARRIYKQLLQKHPGDEELKEKIRKTYVIEKIDLVPVKTRPIPIRSRKEQERAERVITVLKEWLEKLNA